MTTCAPPRSEERRVGKEWRSLCDWSSDVCSSDLETRFSMLETIQEYAREKLDDSGEAETFGEAHALYFLALAERAEPELRGAGQAEWLNRLETEHDNLRAAQIGRASCRERVEITV